MEEKRKFGELELKILNILWEKKQATVLEVQKLIGNNIAYTTIMTVLSRMFNKKLVDRTKEGKNYIYIYKKEKDAEIGGMLEKIKKSIFGGKSFQMVNYLIDNSIDIKAEDLELIGRLIDKKKKEVDRESREGGGL